MAPQAAPDDAALAPSGRPWESVTRAARSSGEHLHAAPDQVIYRSHDLDFALLLESGQHVAVLADAVHRTPYIGGGHGIDEGGVVAAALAVVAGGADCGFDLLQETGEVPELDAVDGALDGTAGRMPDHQDQPGAGGRAGELKTAEDVVVGDVAGDARIKGVADAGIENDLSGCARVNAAEDRGGGVLTFRSGAFLRQIVVYLHLAAAEAFIALEQQLQHLLGLQSIALLLRQSGRRGALP